MGTSNLYGGPKKTTLLPSDYNPGVFPEQNTPLDNNPEQPDPAALENPDEVKPQEIQPMQPSVTWSIARGSMRKAMNDQSRSNVIGVLRNYTKALGGYANATRQATKVRNTANVIYTYFSGTPEKIRKRLEDAGVRFEDRSTKEIFNDICGLLAPIPNDLEDSLTNKALRETVADIASDESIDLNQLECFNEELLQRLVGGLLKHYIFDKLIMQCEQTALKNCERTSNLRDLEKVIKQYIDGIVDSVVPDLVKNGLNPADFNRALKTLCDISYQQMEELQ